MLPLALALPPTGNGRLTTRVIDWSAARAAVAVLHRHLVPPPGAWVSLGCYDSTGRLVGVACLGRPLARAYQAKGWGEVTRVATDGTANACSALYGACRREARRRGVPVLVTYTLPSEGGTSLRAAGWVLDGQTRGGQWSSPSRPRAQRSEVLAAAKSRWVMHLGPQRRGER